MNSISTGIIFLFRPIFSYIIKNWYSYITNNDIQISYLIIMLFNQYTMNQLEAGVE